MTITIGDHEFDVYLTIYNGNKRSIANVGRLLSDTEYAKLHLTIRTGPNWKLARIERGGRITDNPRPLEVRQAAAVYVGSGFTVGLGSIVKRIRVYKDADGAGQVKVTEVEDERLDLD